MSGTDFTARFNNLAQKRGSFCLGIDPTPQLMKQWQLEANAKGLQKMCKIIIEAAGDQLVMVKPQAAYFEKFGPHGMEILQELVECFHGNGTLVLLDAKRGDIGSTSLSYGEAYLGYKSLYKFDAMTLTAYLGFDALIDTFKYAHKVNAGIFLVIESSNPEGAIIQNAVIDSEDKKMTVAQYLAMQTNKFNQSYLNEGIGPIGAVVGATLNNIGKTLDLLKTSLILMPGIGYQGAKMEDLLTTCQGHTNRIIPTSAREVLSVGSDIKLLSDKIKQCCKQSLSFVKS